MDTKEVIEKYSRKLGREISASPEDFSKYSKEYQLFRDETIPAFTHYEYWCNSLGNIIKLKASKKDEARMQKALDTAHLHVTPSQAVTLSVLSFLIVFFFTFLFSAALFLLGVDTGQIFLIAFLGLIASIFIFYYVSSYPERISQRWRLKASSQMVPAVLYVVVYMRHTSNLERAIAFAAEHLQPPLALDLRKVFYDVQVGKFSTIKQSLDSYMESWRDYSPEFIESFHLIESSLFEPSESRRIQILEKAMQVVLDGVYEKMLRFTHDVRAPITNIYMLGVILPTLGLALLPLASTLLKGLLQWYHVFILFNIIVPFFVFYLTTNILAKRPGGYGETELLEQNPLYPKYASNHYYWTAFAIVLPIFLIGLIPLLFHYTPLPLWLGIPNDASFEQLGIPLLGNAKVFGYTTGGTGPFGMGALLLSLFIPLGIVILFSFVFNAKTKEIIHQRNATRALEKEFNSSLFQIGNRLSEGIPAELVFAKVAESARGLRTEEFFRRVNYNIQQQGLSVERAIFDPHRGALIFYPSQLIATSMKVLVESAKKGLNIAAQSLMSISEYVKNIDKINERLKDLLAEIVSDMKSNMTFIAPLLAGVVVGLAGMITLILSKLELLELAGAELGNLQAIVEIFQVEHMIPPYFLQISIGIYLIQIILILTNTLVIIDSGEDRLQKTYLTGKNLQRGIGLYLITASISIIALSLLSSVVLTGFGT